MDECWSSNTISMSEVAGAKVKKLVCAGLLPVVRDSAVRWLLCFLQALIGGGDHQGLDLEDMKQHVNYAGGYDTDHPVIKEFWKVGLLSAPRSAALNIPGS